MSWSNCMRVKYYSSFYSLNHDKIMSGDVSIILASSIVVLDQWLTLSYKNVFLTLYFASFDLHFWR